MKQLLPAMGSVQMKPRANGGDVWVYRYKSEGRHKSKVVGLSAKMTKAQAERKALGIRKEVIERSECATVAQLIHKYEKEGMPARVSTAKSYRSNLRRLEGTWGGKRVDDFLLDTMVLEGWLRNLESVDGKPLSYKTKAHLKAMIHRLVECAMRWGVVEVQRNPIALVELRGVPKRSRPLVLVSMEQYEGLLADPALPEYLRVMVQVAMCLGLRASELLGLRWEDVDLLRHAVTIQRSMVGKHQDDTKTPESEAQLPLHMNLAAILTAWHQAAPVINGWLFGNPKTSRPYHRDSLVADYLKPAGVRVGLPRLGFHAFRHTYRSMLASLGLPIEVQQKLMRHADIKTTLQYGRSSMLSVTRPANAQLVEMLGQRTTQEMVQ